MQEAGQFSFVLLSTYAVCNENLPTEDGIIHAIIFILAVSTALFDANRSRLRLRFPRLNQWFLKYKSQVFKRMVVRIDRLKASRYSFLIHHSQFSRLWFSVFNVPKFTFSLPRGVLISNHKAKGDIIRLTRGSTIASKGREKGALYFTFWWNTMLSKYIQLFIKII